MSSQRWEAAMLSISRPRALRSAAIGLTVAVTLGVPLAPGHAAVSDARVQLAQYYPYGSPSRGYARPPCGAVNNPWGGAARGAAVGAIFGGIGGNAGTGAAVGAGVGLLKRSIQNSNSRANGYCY
jgi:hypothetical protein